MVEHSVEAIQLVLHECSHHRTVEQFVGFSVPEVVEDFVEVEKITFQEHVAVG